MGSSLILSRSARRRASSASYCSSVRSSLASCFSWNCTSASWAEWSLPGMNTIFMIGLFSPIMIWQTRSSTVSFRMLLPQPLRCAPLPVAILIASRSISRGLAFAIFVGSTSLHGAVADAFTSGLHAAFYASMGFMVLAAALSALRAGSSGLAPAELALVS